MTKIQTYDIDSAKRRLLTPQNLLELGITEDVINKILASKPDALKAIVAQDPSKSRWPDGLSINEKIFGKYSGPTAANLGWMAYLEIGAALVEERTEIIQPQADVLSTRAYENRAALGEHQFSDTITFTIENTISWSLEGTSQLTFEGHISGELQSQLEKRLEQSFAESEKQSKSGTDINHNHKDQMGSEKREQTSNSKTDQETSKETYSGRGTASGTGELSAQLMLNITGSVSGTLTTSWGSSSTVSGTLPPGNRVETMATQRRQVKQYTYELPITFGGYVALHYDKPVILVPQSTEPDNPQPVSSSPATVVSRGIDSLGLIEKGKTFRPQGIAETVSTLNVEHIIFDSKPITVDQTQTLGTVRPHKF
ncbi:hypothetical protein BTJ39_19350 [Izhakiella australiensis]|uniref:Uncharacterized protein n=1 Tax=Izhakiella australiensis TaxID=1926881 RepID=A0A1S8YFW5_9GAMM|nr:hypothetical protein [Izhakiella australiensis]OON37974.1 hypothetical protein BTJ39_19350 [Izhakiella australiensis]